MMPSVIPTVASSRAVARTTDPRSSARQGGSGFAALVDAGDPDTDDSFLASTADSPSVAGRQDDAATGKAPPADMSSAIDASWLAAILQGSAPGTTPVEPPATSVATDAITSPTAPPPAGPLTAKALPAPPAADPSVAAAAAATASSVTAALNIVSQADDPPSARLAPSTLALDVTAASSTIASSTPSTKALAATIASDTVPARASTLPTTSSAAVRGDEARLVASPATPQPISLSATAPSRSVVTIAPASEVFAEAIHAVGRRSDGTRDGIGSMLSSPLLPGSAGVMVGAVAASTDRGEASLDMRHDTWPSTMIDHIEKLRDGVDATNTRIRLVPDALGGIDVSLHRHDSGLQVTLLADHAATQAILTDARPQLDALAEARGIRLADAGTGGGGSDSSAANGQRQPPATAAPTAPASAAPVDDDLVAADRRVA